MPAPPGSRLGFPALLIPAQRCPAAVLGDAAFEEILFLAQVDRLAHPGEGVAGPVLAGEADALYGIARQQLDRSELPGAIANYEKAAELKEREDRPA